MSYTEPGSYGLDSYDQSHHPYPSQRPPGPPRTPSPTPSELVELNKSSSDIRAYLNPKRYLHKKYIRELYQQRSRGVLKDALC